MTAHRDAITGKYVTAEHAKTNPDTTVSESPCAECERLRAVIRAQGVALDGYRELERLRAAEPIVRTVGDLTARHTGRRVRITDPADGDSEGELVGFDVDPECISVWLHMYATIECTPDTPCEVLP